MLCSQCRKHEAVATARLAEPPAGEATIYTVVCLPCGASADLAEAEARGIVVRELSR